MSEIKKINIQRKKPAAAADDEPPSVHLLRIGVCEGTDHPDCKNQSPLRSDVLGP